MGSANKDRILKIAEKFVLQGKFASAVNEYLKILKSEADDVILLNTVGDLLVRLNKNAEAVNYFQRVADLYLSNGFILKAIATLKKVFHLHPDNIRVQEALANLYYKQGLYHDACTHYKAVAQKLFETGKELESTAVFQKIFEFEKNDVEVLQRLGNLQAVQGDKPAAANFFKLAGAASLKQRKAETALELLQRSMELNPRDTELIEIFVPAAHAAVKDELAGNVLENLLAVHPEDIRLRQLRARNLIYLGQTEQAEKLLLELYQQQGREATTLLELLDTYLGKKDFEGFGKLAQKLAGTLAAAGDLRNFSEILQRATAQAPEDTSLLEMLSQSHERSNDFAAAAAVESELMARHVLKGDLRKAFASADRLVQWEPRNTEFLQQHRALFQKAYPGKVYEEPSVQPEAVSAVSTGFDLNEISAEDLEEIQLAASGTDSLPETLPEGTEAGSFEITMDDVSLDGLETGWGTLLSEPRAEQPAVETPLEIESHEISIEDVEQLASTEIAPTPADNLSESLQEVDFYLKMGFQDDARSLLAKLCVIHPDSDEVQQRWQELAGSTVFQEEAAARAVSELEPVPDQELKDLSLQIDEAIESLFEFEVTSEETDDGALEYKEGREVRVTGNSPVEGQEVQTHIDLGKAYREMGLLRDAIQEFQQAIGKASNGVRPRDTSLCYSLLANCFLEIGESDKAAFWAQKGLELSDIKDYEKKTLLYDLGRALEVQGKNEEALQFYGRIHDVSPDFRDVSERIKQLGS